MAILEQSWSTEHLQPGKALSYWRDVICENLLQMHIQSSHESAFFGHIEKHAFGPIKANFISVSEQRVWRERTAACNAKDHLFHLIHVRNGVQLIEQYGRSFKVEAGDCLLIDCLAGFEFQSAWFDLRVLDPDGDALGSMLALHHLCQAQGKPSVASWPEPFVVAPHYTFLPGLDGCTKPCDLACL